MAKIKFPKPQKVGRIDLGGGIVITDNSRLKSTSPCIPTKQAIQALTDAMGKGYFGEDKNVPTKYE